MFQNLNGNQEPCSLTHRELRNRNHPRCVVCGPTSGFGLGLNFEVEDDGQVEARFSCGKGFEGYPSVLHGGMVAALLDGAMTNCMFAHGRDAYTVELTVRFRHPVAIGTPVDVRARIVASSDPLYELTAEVLQDEKVMATGKAKFMNRSAAGWFATRSLG